MTRPVRGLYEPLITDALEASLRERIQRADHRRQCEHEHQYHTDVREQRAGGDLAAQRCITGHQVEQVQRKQERWQDERKRVQRLQSSTQGQVRSGARRPHGHPHQEGAHGHGEREPCRARQQQPGLRPAQDGARFRQRSTLRWIDPSRGTVPFDKMSRKERRARDAFAESIRWLSGRSRRAEWRLVHYLPQTIGEGATRRWPFTEKMLKEAARRWLTRVEPPADNEKQVPL